MTQDNGRKKLSIDARKNGRYIRNLGSALGAQFGEILQIARYEAMKNNMEYFKYF